MCLYLVYNATINPIYERRINEL